MENFKVGAILEKLSSLKDGSWKLTLETQEMPPDEVAELSSRIGKFSWLILAGEAQTEVRLPDEPPPEFKTDKTPSARQRNLLFVWWSKLKEKGKIDSQDFEIFRRAKMEAIEGWIKNKIEELEK